VVAVTFVQPDGSRQTVEAKTGTSLMEAAVDNDVAGIVAECGGACSCATCHVYVDAAWVAKLPPPDAQEDGMLDCVLERTKQSRLSCQIEIGPLLDGLLVEVPDAQI
jgi:2Fe-2S ferredoxin